MNKNKKKVTPETKNKVVLVYVGPTLKNRLLTKYRIYPNGIPEYVLDKVTNKKALKKLFVATDNLGAAMLEVKVKGMPLNVYYNMILKEIQNKEE